ncbi:MAG: hypothetical protein HGB17_03650, partial [Syntrophobacteraceae bacterium]|nr:hypothetical protein [Syntrophobacteraceae bacterium]
MGHHLTGDLLAPFGHLLRGLLPERRLRAEVLESLVTQRALLAEAQARRIAIPDSKLRDAILSIEGLKKPDGSFDR